ncbi:MAG TPA: hypothetical protein VFR85_21475, partial [Anaeromyxobacteraceae bacterium]|nr:hypothetical protein [Anaeromyxobacteraceae bacterium]
AAAGISAMPLSSCYLGRPARRGLVLGFGAAGESRTREAVRILAGIVRDALGGRFAASRQQRD